MLPCSSQPPFYFAPLYNGGQPLWQTSYALTRHLSRFSWPKIDTVVDNKNDASISKYTQKLNFIYLSIRNWLVKKEDVKSEPSYSAYKNDQ